MGFKTIHSKRLNNTTPLGKTAKLIRNPHQQASQQKGVNLNQTIKSTHDRKQRRILLLRHPNTEQTHTTMERSLSKHTKQRQLTLHTKSRHDQKQRESWRKKGENNRYLNASLMP